MVPFPLPSVPARGDFSVTPRKDLAKLLEGKLTEACLHLDWPPAALTLALWALSLQPFIHFSPGFPALALVPVEFSVGWFLLW